MENPLLSTTDSLVNPPAVVTREMAEGVETVVNAVVTDTTEAGDAAAGAAAIEHAARSSFAAAAADADTSGSQKDSRTHLHLNDDDSLSPTRVLLLRMQLPHPTTLLPQRLLPIQQQRRRRKNRLIAARNESKLRRRRTRKVPSRWSQPKPCNNKMPMMPSWPKRKIHGKPRRKRNNWDVGK